MGRCSEEVTTRRHHETSKFSGPFTSVDYDTYDIHS